MTAGFQLGVIGSLTLSVASSVAIVICNKALISTLGFPFATTLTSWHLMVTFCTLYVAQHMRFFEPKAIDGQTVVLFGLLNGTSIGLLNLSLGFNSIGFYQMTKLAIIPFTVLLETIFLKKRFSETIKFSLLVLLLGVGIASVTDLKLNLLGSTLSALAIATTCVGQILTNTIQRKLKVSSTQLLYQSAPYQAAILFATGPIVDQFLTGRSVFAHKYTLPVLGFIILSCLIAVSVNFSTFLVIGTTSPVTYQVLGHLKTCLVLSFGYTLLHDPFTMRNVMGILVAIFGMALYSYFSVREGKKKSAGDALPVSQVPDKDTEPLVATKDTSDAKKANGVSHDC
ncbi:UDP-xylose transporter 1-like [Phragmites australis]|uniref:UDP-xylose transporter 1-like n=1 Tax=Phragmites australis TaxID=29695 RepID=UPI002D7A284E|nr:UDP-xylose transporter 1-like [Phragmites australis]XP_062222706.1 UDP-xylose transporter 1-like [Phragmites australis]XP_062222708.1 UDP-xylose transporter 1-like [Phragmites australis]XP_062222709.1 UDP-xylose transporter 1-like [Phragmites australis]